MARKIRFEFVGDTSQLQGSLDQVQQDSDKLGGSFDDTFNKKGAGGALAMGKQFVKAHPALMAMVAASAALGVALVKASQATIDFAARADVIAKKARAIGTSAEDLQVMQGALELGGVAAETTANAIQKLSVNLGMAAKGSKMQVEALEDLNLTFEQLEAVPLDEKIALIADGMVAMTSQSKRAQAAQALLGRGAVDMLAAFDEGGAAIRKSSEMVKAAGIISNETAKESEFLTDAVTIATRQWQRLKDGALEPLIPVVTVIVTKLGEMFQVLSETGVLEATAKAVAFVAEKFIGLTDEVERFKKETSDAAAAQSDSSADLEKYKGKIAELSGVVAEAREKQKFLNDLIKATPWRDHTKTLEDVAQIERELNSSSNQIYEDGKLRHGGRIGAAKELRTWTKLLEMEEARLSDARLKAQDASRDLAEKEKKLADARKKAAEDEKKRAARSKAYAAAAKANMAAATTQVETWSKANEQATIDRLEDIEKLDAEEARLLETIQETAGDAIAATGVSAAKKAELAEAAMKRIEGVEQEYAQKRADLMVEMANAERDMRFEGVRNAEEAVELQKQMDAELHAERMANSQTQGEFMRETWDKDMEDLAVVNAQIMSMHREVFDAIGAMAKVVYDEKAVAFAETSDRIADIDEALMGDLTDSAREQLEREKAVLEEQSAAEKEAALDAWRANKAVSLTSAIISTALAVINGLTTVPFPAGIVAAAAAGIAGAASIAAIAAEQPPQLHSGGMIPAGLSGQSMASDEVFVRARQGEAMLSPQGVAAAGGERGVDALNAGAGAGGGTVNIIRVGPRTTEAIMHDTLRISSSRLSRAFGSVRPRVGRHDARSGKA